jgi:TonB family protein
MKRILLATAWLILVASAAIAQPANGPWKRYTVKGEEFSVILPTLPAMTTRKPMVERFATQRRERMLGAYADGVAFTISCFQNPGRRETLDQFIEQEIFTHSGWDKSTELDLKVNGFEGKQYLSPNKVPGTMQIFVTNNNIYRFQAFGAPADDARVKQFFSSILLGKKMEGIEVSDGIGIAYDPDTEPQTNAFQGKDVDRKVVIVMKPDPGYSEEGRKNAITGAVLLKAVLTAKGNVENIRVASPLPYGLTEKAMEAAKKMKFIPAMKDGKFVPAAVVLEYHFNLY